jgi:sphinganine-1-phosphate aldolase
MWSTVRNVVEGVAATYILYRVIVFGKSLTLKGVFRRLNRISYIKNKVDSEVEQKLGKVKPGLISDRFKHVVLPTNPEAMQRRVVLSDDPMGDNEIMERIDRICLYNKSHYKISGAIYTDEDRFSEMVGEIYARTAWLNPTHASVWPELTQMEAETYALICELFHLTDSSPAILTPGGTMSNIQAIYTYRNQMEVERGITKPNIVAPNTAHTSFKKACQILKIEYRMCDVDPVTGKADMQSMRRLVNSNTICVVGSAPSFPYGIIDPISEISALARERGVGFHVDCCLGGFMVPFADSLSEVCDFRDEGITSISADPHKFGQSPKGISILMFRTNAIKQYLTFVDLNWTGGLYIMPDFFGSRAGSNVAVLWAILQKMGRTNYTTITHELIQMRKTVCDLIQQSFASEGDDSHILEVHGDPELSTFGLRSKKYNIHFINKKMSQYGWEFNSLPDGLHFCLTNKHLINSERFIPEFMQDLQTAVEYVAEHPDEDPGDTAQIYCSAQDIPDFAEDILDKIGRTYIEIQTMVTKGPCPIPTELTPLA